MSTSAPAHHPHHHTTIETSRFIAKAFGLYLIIVTISMLLNASHFMTIMNDIIEDRVAMLFISFMALMLGILLVLSHNVWTRDWRVLVTILCWATLLKGIFYILCPEQAVKLNHVFLERHGLFYFDAIVFLLLGVLLSYKGFVKKHAH